MEYHAIKKCTAVQTDGSRCNNIINKGVNHCNLHYEKAKKLRLKYKKLWASIYDININDSLDITELMKYYAIMNKAFEARMKHRKYAFVPECYDNGHNYQFEMVQKKMNQCEEKLFMLYQQDKNIIPEEEINNTSKDDNVNDKINDKINDNIKITKKINKQREERNKSEVDLDIMIEKYIEENKRIENDKLDLIVQIWCMICADDIDGADVFITAILIIIYELDKDEIFEPNHIVRICKHPGCTECLQNIGIRALFCDCGCIADDNRLFRFLCESDISHLEKTLNVLSDHMEIIRPIINDVRFYYNIFGRRMLINPYELTFAVKENRWVFKQYTIKKNKLKSKELANKRIKKKLINNSEQNRYNK